MRGRCGPVVAPRPRSRSPARRISGVLSAEAAGPHPTADFGPFDASCRTDAPRLGSRGTFGWRRPHSLPQQPVRSDRCGHALSVTARSHCARRKRAAPGSRFAVPARQAGQPRLAGRCRRPRRVPLRGAFPPAISALTARFAYAVIGLLAGLATATARRGLRWERRRQAWWAPRSAARARRGRHGPIETRRARQFAKRPQLLGISEVERQRRSCQASGATRAASGRVEARTFGRRVVRAEEPITPDGGIPGPAAAFSARRRAAGTGREEVAESGTMG
jgi:hypothetical protein